MLCSISYWVAGPGIPHVLQRGRPYLFQNLENVPNLGESPSQKLPFFQYLGEFCFN